MSMHSDELMRLAAQAQCGNRAALATLSASLRTYAPVIVRRALGAREDHSPLARRIRAAARHARLADDQDPDVNCEQWIRSVAKRVCDGLLTQLCGKAARCPLEDETIVA